MNMRDFHNRLHPVVAIDPVVITDNTAAVSNVIDRRGYSAIEFLVAFGTFTDGSLTDIEGDDPDVGDPDGDPDMVVTALLEESDSSIMTGATAVADADMLGSENLTGFTFADSNETRKLGYIGSKRYLRLTFTPANNTGNIPLACVVIKALPLSMPTANPPQ